MIKLISKYKTASFKEKTIMMTRFSIILNMVLAIAKFVLAIVLEDLFFFVAGVLNLFIMTAKNQCYLGVKYPNKKTFKYRNIMTGVFLFLSGFQYGVYMTRLVFRDTAVMDYDMYLGIAIALVSFIELGFAIKGCFNSFGKGHYYRNIKLINLCSALTAMVLTEIAIMSFASDIDPRRMNGLFGMGVSIIIELIALFVLIAPKVSIVDKEHNVYRLINQTNKTDEENINIRLTKSKFYGDYIYVATNNGNRIDGNIIKGKSPLFKWNIWIKILVIVLSEILIFPYAIGALVFYFKNFNVIKKLDKIMLEKGYIKEEQK